MEFEQIVLHRIQQSRYYKEKCFGINAASLVDRSVQIQYIGGTFGGNQTASEFLCLLYRLTIIKPTKDIVIAYIKNDSFKYLTALALFYCRISMDPVTIYELLEPFYQNYSKLRFRSNNDVSIIHMDEFVDQLLNNDRVCGLILPRISKRAALEDLDLLPLYASPIEKEDEEDIDIKEEHKGTIPQEQPLLKSKKGHSKSKISKLFKKKTVLPDANDVKRYPDQTLEEVNQKRIEAGLLPLLELRDQ